MPRSKSIGVRLASGGDYWQAVWYTTDGRRKRKSIGAKRDMSKSRARRECDRIAQQLAVNPSAREKQKSPTLAEWIEAYQELKAGESSQATVREIRTTGDKLQSHFGASTRIDKITRLQAETWRSSLYRDGNGRGRNRGPGLSEASVRKHCRIAKTMFHAAVDADLIIVNPFDRLKSGAVASDRKPLDHIDEKTMMRVVDAATGDWRILIALCAFAGLRRSEAFRLQWPDIKWDQNRLIVEHEGERTTKRRRREVLLEPLLEQILLDHHDQADGPMVINLSQSNVERNVRAAIKRAGVPEWNKPLHSLRQWRADKWAQTYPAHVVAAWMGHSITVAAKHYLTVPESMYARSAPKAPQFTADRIGH